MINLYVVMSVSIIVSSVALGKDTGERVDLHLYQGRSVKTDPYANNCTTTTISLTQVSGPLYRHTVGSPPNYGGLVLITNEGALVVDPTRTCAAVKLKEEIQRRFKVDVKYVIYTHAHFDHIGGGQIFQNGGATVVAHRNAIEPIFGEQLPTAIPNRVFDDQMKIELGGETIEMSYVTPSHSDSMILVYFPKYKALQCTDVCGSDSLPFNDFPDFYYDGWIQTLKRVQSLDIKWVDDGHHTLANKDQQKNLLNYMEDLHDQILTLVREGQSWDEAYRNVKFKDVYKHWDGFGSKRYLNVLGMYRWVTSHRRGVW